MVGKLTSGIYECWDCMHSEVWWSRNAGSGKRNSSPDRPAIMCSRVVQSSWCTIPSTTEGVGTSDRTLTVRQDGERRNGQCEQRSASCRHNPACIQCYSAFAASETNYKAAKFPFIQTQIQ